MSVTIYTTSSCPWCGVAKQYFSEHKIKYNEVNVQEDITAAREMVAKSGQMGVPVIDIDGQIIIGFDKNKIDRLLKLN